jgi:hypothetical protein
MKNMIANKFDKVNPDAYNEADVDEFEYEDGDDTCDLNVTKLCDSCGECLELNKNDFRVVRIEGLAPRDFEVDEYLLDEETLNDDDNTEESAPLSIEYIEDIPKLREEYDKKIDKLLGRE